MCFRQDLGRVSCGPYSVSISLTVGCLRGAPDGGLSCCLEQPQPGDVCSGVNSLHSPLRLGANVLSCDGLSFLGGCIVAIILV